MKQNDYSNKPASREALAILRTVPEGKERCAASVEARRVASTHGYINVRGVDMEKAIQNLAARAAIAKAKGETL